MTVTAAMVKELKDRTGAGMMDCKNALMECDGDMENAIKLLREKGLAAAAKKAGRIAAEGLTHVAIGDNGNKGVVVEINCETDFVAKNETFIKFVGDVSTQLMTSSAKDVDEFLKETWSLDKTLTVENAVSSMVATIGEKISIRRFAVLEKGANCKFATYIHGGGKIAVLLEIESEKESDLVTEAAKNLCMQIAALFPKYVSQNDLPASFIESEREIIRTATMNEEAEAERKKPQQVIDKMVEGRLQKQLKEICLLDQLYVKDNEITCEKYLENISKEVGCKVTAKRFVCFERGEGIEKKEDNFAEEVSRMAGK